MTTENPGPDTANEAPASTAPDPADVALGGFRDIVQDRPRPPAAEGQPALIMDGFSVYYGDYEAVQKINVEIPRHEVTAMIGPSGCGKSTLLNAINRMTDLIPGCTTSGTLLFEGDNIGARDYDVVWLRRRIGMVFQKPNPFPKSIYDNVAYGPRLHGTQNKAQLDEIVERSLRRAALWNEVKDRLRHDGLSLSGGQAQRLCIARSLAIDPEILLFDEPTSALDPNATDQIEDLVEDLRGDYTVLIVTHSMQQAARVSDNALFLYKGRLVEFNRSAQFFTAPAEQQTKNYIAGRFG